MVEMDFLQFSWTLHWTWYEFSQYCIVNENTQYVSTLAPVIKYKIQRDT